MGSSVRRKLHMVNAEFDMRVDSSGQNVVLRRAVTLMTLLRVVTAVLAVAQWALFILFVVTDCVHMYMLTWWQQVLFTVYLPTLFVALLLEGWLLWLVVAVATPVMALLSFVINLAIVILVSQNGDLLDDEHTSASKLYVGNFLIHPLVALVIWGTLFPAGLWLLMRTVVGSMWRRFEHGTDRLAYALFFVYSPLPLFVVYRLIWPIAKHYPSGVDEALLWLMLLGLLTVGGMFLLACITISDDALIDVPDVRRVWPLAPRIQHHTATLEVLR